MYIGNYNDYLKYRQETKDLIAELGVNDSKAKLAIDKVNKLHRKLKKACNSLGVRYRNLGKYEELKEL